MEINKKDIENLLDHKDEIPKTKGYRKKERVNKLRADAKWDTRLAEMATRLIAAGITYEDIGSIIGVSESAVISWTRKYPDFKIAAEAGHQAANAITLGQMLRCAWGYDFTEKTVKRKVTLDEFGNEVPSESSKEAIVTEHTKHQPPNPDLLKFIAMNRMSEEFSRSPIVTQENTLQIVTTIEEDRIRRFAGSLFELASKQVENKILNDNESGKS